MKESVCDSRRKRDTATAPARCRVQRRLAAPLRSQESEYFEIMQHVADNVNMKRLAGLGGMKLYALPKRLNLACPEMESRSAKAHAASSMRVCIEACGPSAETPVATRL